MWSKTREVGFSTLELIVVVGIFAVIAAITLPSARATYSSYALDAAATSLAQQLNRCRHAAVSANVPMRIRVAEHYSRIDQDRNGVFDSDDGPFVLYGQSASVVAMEPTDGVVTFTSRGELPIDLTPSFTITYAGVSRVVSVDPRGAVTVGQETAAQ